MKLWSEFQNLSLDSELAPPNYHECQFSVKMDNFEIFGLNLGKLPNYVRYFGSNNIERVAESWVETEMSWVEVNMRWVEVHGAGWRWVHGLVTPKKNDSMGFENHLVPWIVVCLFYFRNSIHNWRGKTTYCFIDFCWIFSMVNRHRLVRI